ncbi:MAG: dihydropteroate synthase [Sedimentisphaerales bacterium]|nr:dihydropteroate synthase [Sedimentisphaerales bacterium]
MSDDKFYQIGESVHASIPKTGAVMKELVNGGPDAYETSSDALDYMVALIADQAAKGADYIAVNVDAFGEDDPALAVDLMRKYVALVKKYSCGVPVCIDSSDLNVLKAGLDEWYSTPGMPIPLVNSVKVSTIDQLLPLRKNKPFKVIGMLVDEAGRADEADTNAIYKLARTIFDAATKKYGFAPDDIFFDTTTFPLAIDMPMTPGTPSFTYRCFESIKKIKSDPDMKDVHFSLGITNCVNDLPARKIGVCRAYVQKGREYGLDGGIVNINHQYGKKPADPDLLALVAAFAENDGSAEKSMNAMMLMGEFCRQNRK